MSYRLGVDLGTAYSSAAVAVDGRARIVPLGNRSAVLPSVVLLRPDGEVLVGEAADRRGMAEPERVAREFKRRFGDPTPFDLGGTKLLAEQLMGRLLLAIYQATVDREGGAPDLLALTHPAAWGNQKRNALLAAVEEAAVPQGLALPPIMLVSEPEAAAIYYAESEHLEIGEVVAVYDLGGGTFDAALLRRSATGFELMGPPEGIDRLGGVDFDAAVYAHVNRFLDGAIDRLDHRQGAVAGGVARLRADCVEAKEALSADTDVTIPVLLPGLRADLRLTRAELESMIRPALQDSIGALQRAMRSAHVVPGDVRVVLLVGGSSRIPLVAQLVGGALGRPVAVDVHPKHAVALGAALAADVAQRGRAAQAVEANSAALQTPRPSTGQAPEPVRPAPSGPVPSGPGSSGLASGGAAAGGPGSGGVAANRASLSGAGSNRAGDGAVGAEPQRGQTRQGRRGRTVLIGALAVLVAAMVGLVVVLSGGDDPGSADAGASGAGGSTPPASSAPGASRDTTAGQSSTPSVAPVTAPPVTTSPVDPADLPLPEDCQGKPNPFVCALAVHVDDEGKLVVPFRTTGYIANITARHIHFFFPAHPEIAEDRNNAGSGGTKQAGHWILWDDPNPFGGATAYSMEDAKAIGATEICVLVADGQHRVTVDTGNCLPLPG